MPSRTVNTKLFICSLVDACRGIHPSTPSSNVLLCPYRIPTHSLALSEPSPQYLFALLSLFHSLGLSSVPANILPPIMASAPSAYAIIACIGVDMPPSAMIGTYSPVSLKYLSRAQDTLSM